MAAGQAFATVTRIVGKAFARDVHDRLRPLKEGDTLREGETLVTAPGARVELALANGEPLALGADQTVTLTAELAEATRPDRSDAELGDATVEKVIQALNQDGTIDELLEDPAAGNDGGSGGGVGNNFVRLLRIAEDVSPLSFQFDATSRDAVEEVVATTGGVAAAEAETVPEEEAPPAPNEEETPPPPVEEETPPPPTEEETPPPPTEEVTPPPTPTNFVPVAVADSVSAVEDTPFIGTVASNDTPSADGGNVWALVSGPANGGIVFSANGDFTYTPNADFNGADSFTYSITDADGSVSQATVSIDVAATNDVPVAVNDSVSATEDTPFVGTVAGNDSPSADGGNVWALVSGPANGGIVFSANGDFTYTPNADFNGADSFTYSITDADGSVSQATVSIDVAATNDVPVAVADSINATEDTPFVGTVASNDSPSADGGNVWALVSGPANGGIVFSANGDFTYTPNADFNGADSFTYSITDADGSVSQATVSIDVAATNDVPVAVADSINATEDTPFVGTVASNDSPSADGGNVWALVSGPANGGIVFSANGDFTYTPNADFNGADSFTYSITDIDGSISTATVAIDVAATNDVPVAVNDSVSATEDTPFVGTVAGNDSPSADGGNVWALVSGPANGGIVFSANGDFTYTPNADFNGADSFTYSITDIDGSISTATVAIDVAATNDVPVAVNDSVSATEDTPFVGTVAGNDSPSADGGNVWALVSGPANGGIVFSANGDFTYTPNADFNGADSFTYSITDIDGSISTATVAIDVAATNDVPVAVADTVNATEDTPFVGTVASNDSPSADGGNVWALVSGPANGGIVFSANGDFTYTPNADFNGADSFTYSITDADGSVSQATVSIDVAATNDVPVAVADSINATEDTPFVGTVASNDTPSADGGNVWALVSGPANGGIVFSANGDFTYTPNADFNGADSFTYSITDADGSVSQATVAIDVAAANDGPVAVNDTAVVSEDGILTVPADGVMGNDSDIDGPTLDVIGIRPGGSGAFSGVSGGGTTVSGTYGALTINPDGSYTYVPGPAAQALNATTVGHDVFTYRISDGTDSAEATLTIIVTGENDAAVISGPVTGTVQEDATLTATGTLTVTDVDSGNGMRASSASGTYGDFSIDAAGVWTYTLRNADANVQALPEGASQTEAFVVRALDGTPQTITVTVLGMNEVPTVANVSAGGAEDPSALIPVTLAGQDVDGSIASFTLTSLPANGTLYLDAARTQPVAAETPLAASGNALTLYFQPDADWNGATSFAYGATDDQGASSPAGTASITVTAVNDLPTAADDSASTGEDVVLTVAADGVLANDGDVDADALTVASVNGDAANVGVAVAGSYGTLVLNGDGGYSYTPNAAAQALVEGQSATDVFSYGVADGNGGAASATLSITVQGADDAPLINGPLSGSVTEDGVTVATGTLTVSDADAGQSSFVAQSAVGTYGSFTLSTDGTWTYILDNDATHVQALAASDVRTESFTIASADGTTRTIVVTVNGANDVPLAVAESISTTEDSAYTGTVASNDTQSADGGNVWALGSGPSNGGIAFSANGTFTYTPNADFSGADSFTYSITDADGSVSTAEVSISVAPVADTPEVAVALDTPTPTTTRIDISNATASGQDFRVTAYRLNGSVGDVSIVSGAGAGGRVSGFGVAGSASGADGEIGHSGQRSEKIAVDFGTPASSVTVELAWLNDRETAQYVLYDGDANVIGGDTIRGVTDVIDAPFTVTSSGGTPISRVEFTTPGREDDYLIHSITYTTGSRYPVSITATPTDVDHSESVTAVVVSVPAGVTLSAGTPNADGTWTLPLAGDGAYTVSVDATTQQVTITGLDMSVPNTMSDPVTVTVVATVTDGTDTASASASASTQDGGVGASSATDDGGQPGAAPSIELSASLAISADASNPTLEAELAADVGAGPATKPLPSVSGNIFAEAGVDGSAASVAWRGTSGYGTFVGQADGSYSFVLNEETRGALQPGDTLTVWFEYTVTDGEGGTITAALEIRIEGSLDTDGTISASVFASSSGNDALLTLAADADVDGAEGTDAIGDGSDTLAGLEADVTLDGTEDVDVGVEGSGALLGELGADTIPLSLSGEVDTAATTAEPGAGADTGGDTLNPRDLLPEDDSIILPDPPSSDQPTDGTAVVVSGEAEVAGGGGAGQGDQAITLEGANLLSGSLTTDQQLIQDLLTKNTPILD